MLTYHSLPSVLHITEKVVLYDEKNNHCPALEAGKYTEFINGKGYLQNEINQMYTIATSEFKASPFKTQLLQTSPHAEIYLYFRGKMKLPEQFHLVLRVKGGIPAHFSTYELVLQVP